MFITCVLAQNVYVFSVFGGMDLALVVFENPLCLVTLVFASFFYVGKMRKEITHTQKGGDL